MKMKLLMALRPFPLTLIPSPALAGEAALTPTPLPQAGEGSSIRSEPSALTRDLVHLEVAA